MTDEYDLENKLTELTLSYNIKFRLTKNLISFQIQYICSYFRFMKIEKIIPDNQQDSAEDHFSQNVNTPLRDDAFLKTTKRNCNYSKTCSRYT